MQHLGMKKKLGGPDSIREAKKRLSALATEDLGRAKLRGSPKRYRSREKILTGLRYANRRSTPVGTVCYRRDPRIGFHHPQVSRERGDIDVHRPREVAPAYRTRVCDRREQVQLTPTEPQGAKFVFVDAGHVARHQPRAVHQAAGNHVFIVFRRWICAHGTIIAYANAIVK